MTSDTHNKPVKISLGNLPVPPEKFVKQSQHRSRSPLMKKNISSKDNSRSSSMSPLATSQQSSCRPQVTKSLKSQSRSSPLPSQKTTSHSHVTKLQTNSVSSTPQPAISQQSTCSPPVTKLLMPQSRSSPLLSQKSTSQTHVTKSQTTSVSSSRFSNIHSKYFGTTPEASNTHWSISRRSRSRSTSPQRSSRSRSRRSSRSWRSSRSRSRRSSWSRGRRSSWSRSPRSSRSRSPRSSRSRSHRISRSRSRRLSRSSPASAPTSSRTGSQLRTQSSLAAEETPTRREAFPMSQARFQKRMLVLMTEMRQQLSTLCRTNRTPGQGADIGDVMPRKAENLDEMAEIEEQLNNPEHRRLVIEKLGNVGGLNLKDNVKKIMDRFMTNDVMAGFNMKGNKGKMAFQKTAIFMVVQASVMKTFNTASEHEVDLAIASCLKYAPDRRGGGGRKKSI